MRGLDHLRDAGFEPDDRTTEAVAVVDGKRGADGRWLLDTVHEGEVYFQMDDGEGQPSRWITLIALRVLDWFAPGRAGGS